MNSQSNYLENIKFLRCSNANESFFYNMLVILSNFFFFYIYVVFTGKKQSKAKLFIFTIFKLIILISNIKFISDF